MLIRRAKNKDLYGINNLLKQVLSVHHEGRPDLFKGNAKKYTDDELLDIINDDKKPIFVATEGENVLGYAFCVYVQHIDNNILTDIKTLYIDDLCVDENARGKHVGKSLYEYVVNFAKENGFYNITLNVWELNEGAKRFYEKCGLSVQKTGMEFIL
ncbi:MAG: GNAT family N-acetyltransferase [Clostridia bacterium]|nr:GNAT family N-acetyltransferase [Clostridia bacterium]